MASIRKLLNTVLSGQSDANVRFSDLCRLALNLGFTERIRGSHHIYTHTLIQEILNFQTLPGGKAKPYQVKQLRQIVLQYGLRIPERK